MQLTLVSHYGPKPPALARLIIELQELLGQQLGTSFLPYALEQVHATVVGLEGVRVGDKVRGENVWKLRGEERWIDFESLLNFMRSPSFPEFTVQAGGFRAGDNYGFVSQGQPPQVRSFSLRNETAVAMGWPRAGDCFPSTLEALRRRFQAFGILHKWHARPEDEDNDWFFVLGRTQPGIVPSTRLAAEASVRLWLESRPPCLISVTPQTLRFVAYIDARLCPKQSRVLDWADAGMTAALIASVYD